MAENPKNKIERPPHPEPNLSSDDPFEFFGLQRSATPEQMKVAYRDRLRKFHPDNVPIGVSDEADYKRKATAITQKVIQMYEKVDTPEKILKAAASAPARSARRTSPKTKTPPPSREETPSEKAARDASEAAAARARATELGDEKGVDAPHMRPDVSIAEPPPAEVLAVETHEDSQHIEGEVRRTEQAPSLKSKLLSSTAVIPEMAAAASPPKSAVRLEVPEAANSNAMAEVAGGEEYTTPAETKAKLSGLIGELHTTGKAEFMDAGEWQDWKGRVEAYQPKPKQAEAHEAARWGTQSNPRLDETHSDNEKIADIVTAPVPIVGATEGERNAEEAASNAARTAAWEKKNAERKMDSADRLGMNAKEAAPSRFAKAMRWTADRGIELGKKLVALPGNALRDVKALGKGAAHVVTHPFESWAATKSAGERVKNYGAYFLDREKSLGEKSKKLGADIYALGEAYRKLPFETKMYLSAAFLSTSAITGGVGVLMGLVSGAHVAQRALSGLGTYTLVEAYKEKSLMAAEKQSGAARTRLDSWKKHGLAVGAASLVALGVGGIEGLFVGGEHGAEWLYHAMSPEGSTEHIVITLPIASEAVPALRGPITSPDVASPTMPAAPTPEHLATSPAAPPPAAAPAEASSSASIHGETAVPVGAPVQPVEVAVHHEPIHHHHAAHGAELGIGAREQLETKFLNDWQLEHPGTMPSTEQINEYVAQNSPGAPPVAPEVVAPSAPAASVETAPPAPAHVPVTDDMLKAQRIKMGIDQAPSAAEPVPPPAPHVEAPAPATGAPTPLEHLQSFKPAEAAPPSPTPSTLPPLENMGNIGPHPVPHPLETSPSGENVVVTSPHETISGLDYASAHAGEAHLYADEAGKNFTLWGGTFDQQMTWLTDHAAEHPNTTIDIASADGKHMLHYPIGPDGKIAIALPAKRHGFFGFFQSLFSGSLVEAPDPKDAPGLFKSVVQ